MSKRAVRAPSAREDPSARGRYSPQQKKTTRCQVDSPQGRRHCARNRHPRELHHRKLMWVRWKATRNRALAMRTGEGALGEAGGREAWKNAVYSALKDQADPDGRHSCERPGL